MIRLLILGYCFGIRSERRLCDEVHLNLAYRWFCRLGLDGSVLGSRRASVGKLRSFTLIHSDISIGWSGASSGLMSAFLARRSEIAGNLMGHRVNRA